MKDYFNRNIGNSEYYKVFLEFNEKVLKSDNSILRDIIKYDYLTFNKRRGMPEFLESRMTKEEEIEIKNKLREYYSFKENYIESFCIDIKEFINNNTIINKNTYYLFGYNGGSVEITDKIS